MKAHSRHSTTPGSAHAHGHAHGHSPSLSRSHSRHRSHAQPSNGPKPAKSSTPATSPRPPYSVGQPHLSPQRAKTPSGRPPDSQPPSPNYFGLVFESSGNGTRDSSGLPREGWSPATSSVQSFAAAIPKQVSVDANPDFQAFKRQVDLNRGRTAALATAHDVPSASKSDVAPARPKPSRWHTHASDSRPDSPFGRASSRIKINDPSTSRIHIDRESLHGSAHVSADSQRNSDSITGQSTYESPRPMDPSQHRLSLTRAEDRDPRLSVMEHKLDPPSPGPDSKIRAATLPAALDASQSIMISALELKDVLETVDADRVLLLDIRSSQSFATSRVKGALNLCIPTTLLKRATFNIHKLQQTFQQGPDAEKFSHWRETDWIIVYDAHSSDKRDAVTAQNMIKKFTSEAFSGRTCILRGGFSGVQDRLPELVDNRSTAELAGTTGPTQAGGLAPVIGGVGLPSSGNDFNPFFSNIRQNMDLADGVGQYELLRPRGLHSPALPRWLREAASKPDRGKKVSDKFLHIERCEQSRMRGAYSIFNPNQPDDPSQVQLSGVEQGGKNRYKDILPFEHARVRLLNRPQGSCDYINASYLKSSRSNKRFIATQGPLPATFEDFWSVIWDQDVRVIVMLTAESEGGQLKCHPYWQGRDFGPIKLKSLSEKRASLDIDKHRAESSSTVSMSSYESGRRRANTMATLETCLPPSQPPPDPGDAPYVIIRKFALSHAAHPFSPIREITHLHFPAWPDFGTPAQPSHLLALVELANLTQRSALPVANASVIGSRKESVESAVPMAWFDEPEPDPKSRPMLVHCSAGCGRTGAFCTVDSVIDMLKRQRQAKAKARRPRDAEGDVAMADGDGAVSPKSRGKMAFERGSVRRAEEDGSVFTPSRGIDTSWLQDDSVDLIQQTVEDFREQRLSTVQSLRQFVLCYETVLEWVHRIQDGGTPAATTGRQRAGSLQQPR